MRTNAGVGHTFSPWPSVWCWSVKLHTSAEECGGAAGRDQRCSLISSSERGGGSISKMSSSLIITPRNWCWPWLFEGFSGGFSVPLAEASVQRSVSRARLFLLKYCRFKNVKHPFTLALFNDMLITDVHHQTFLGCVKAPSGEEDCWVYH